MAQLSERLNRLSPSETLAMSQKSSELKAQGIDIINMSVGEPDFNTPDHIKEAAKKAVDDNFSRYSPVAGYPALRNAIVAKLKNENGLDYTAAQISCANGAKQSVCNTVMALVNAGDEVIIPAPYWVSYPEMVKLADGTPVTIPAGIEQDFKITPAQLEAAITPNTRALILCSPSNPTGSVYTQEELAGLDRQFRDVVSHAKRHVLIFGDRFPFRYFADEYGLDYYAAFPGCAGDTEPSAATMAFLIDKVKEEKVPAVLKMELSNDDIANAIAEATGTEVKVFYSCHNLSAEDFESGETYLSMMQKNVETLKEVLNGWR